MQQTMYYVIYMKDPFIPVSLPNMRSTGNTDLLLLGVALFIFFFNCYYSKHFGFALKNVVFCKNEGYSDKKNIKEFRLQGISEQQLE